MKANKIREYILVKDKNNHPKLEEVGCYEWNGDLKYTDEVFEMLDNVFKMDKLITEVSYVIAFDHAKKVKGVCRVGQGNANESPMPLQSIYTFLLLTGANAFIVAHNHISEMPEVSAGDKIITTKVNSFALMFEMEFIGHMILNPCGYVIDGGTMNGTAREYDEYGELYDCGTDGCEPFSNNSKDMEEFKVIMEEMMKRKRG